MTLLAVGNSLYGGACGTLVIIAPTWECGSYLTITKNEANSNIYDYYNYISFVVLPHPVSHTNQQHYYSFCRDPYKSSLW